MPGAPSGHARPLDARAVTSSVTKLLPGPGSPPNSVNLPLPHRPGQYHSTACGSTSASRTTTGRNPVDGGWSRLVADDRTFVFSLTPASRRASPYPCADSVRAARRKSPPCSSTAYTANLEYDLSG